MAVDEKAGLTEKQVEAAGKNIPVADYDDIRAAYLGPRVEIVLLSQHDFGFYDYDGKRHNVTPGGRVSISERRANELLRAHDAVDGTPGTWERFDPKQKERYAKIAKDYRAAIASVRDVIVRRPEA